jgi:hypothetical protein
MTVQAETKWCPGCERDLPPSAWFPSSPYGKCKECRTDYQRERYRSGRDTLVLRVVQLEETVDALVTEVIDYATIPLTGDVPELHGLLNG